jgi:hypothetical protein
MPLHDGRKGSDRVARFVGLGSVAVEKLVGKLVQPRTSGVRVAQMSNKLSRKLEMLIPRTAYNF